MSCIKVNKTIELSSGMSVESFVISLLEQHQQHYSPVYGMTLIFKPYVDEDACSSGKSPIEFAGFRYQYDYELGEDYSGSLTTKECYEKILPEVEKQYGKENVSFVEH